MTEKEIKNIYTYAQEFLALLGSNYGSKLRKEKPELIAVAEKVVSQYETKYMDAIFSDKPELKKLMEETAEVRNTLNILPTTSVDSIKVLSDIVTANTAELQNKLLFDPKLFYNKYILSISAPNTEELFENIEENEKFSIWFNGSKAVNDAKKPLLVYHGTGGLIDEFNEFSFSPFPACYFAESKSYSDWFATYRGGKNILFKCYLRVLNPIDLTPYNLEKVPYDEFITYIKLKYGYDLPESKRLKAISDQAGGMWAWQYLRNGVDWIKYLKDKKEFDGFVYYENNPQDQVNGKENVTRAWMVFDGSQIKSADIRNTTYSLSSKSFTMKEGGTT